MALMVSEQNRRPRQPHERRWFAAELCRPLPVAAVTLLLFNDHVGKPCGLLPGMVSGKLSDLAGLFFFPILLFSMIDLVLPWISLRGRERLAWVDAQIRRAAGKTKLRIPIDRAAVADPPYDYEDRLQPVNLHFKKHAVWVPERHDLLLMKAVRAARHDVEVLRPLHKSRPFQLEVLLDRYNREMGQAIIEILPDMLTESSS